MLNRLAAGVLGLGLAAVDVAAGKSDAPDERRMMIDDIREIARRTARETGRPQLGERVLGAMGRVARHAFVAPEQKPSAYRDRPLSIGHGQTISQPYIVALMTDLLELEPADRVLEVGTGSGYQTAVLAELASHVFSVEIVEPLGVRAAETLRTLGYGNVTTRIGDGYGGWPDAAPFDAIIVTAAPDHIPQALIDQLAAGGRLVIPVGGVEQDLRLIEKGDDGKTVETEIVAVRFVPLTRAP